MGKEIERKFLVRGDAWRATQGIRIRQGYLSTHKARSVRVRVAGDRARLTVKGKTRGATRSEFEYDIPRADAEEMLEELCERPLIEKVRRCLEHGGLTWEVDEFHGENEGLVVAEVELEREDQPFERPPWLGEEVTHDPRFFNANLVRHPFRKWVEEPGG